MGKKHRRRIALCTILAVIVTASAAAAAVDNTHRTRYLEQKVLEGAVNVPVLAQCAYRDALTSLASGDADLAQNQLQQALLYDPDYSDAYFTLARLKLRAFEPDAPVYLIQAISALWRDFRFLELC